jgi:hypothetical protein
VCPVLLLSICMEYVVQCCICILHIAHRNCMEHCSRRLMMISLAHRTLHFIVSSVFKTTITYLLDVVAYLTQFWISATGNAQL